MAIQKSVFSTEEAARFGFTHKFVINRSDISGATGVQQNIMTLTGSAAPPDFGALITKCACRLVTAFTDTTATLDVGDTASATQYITAFNVKTAVPGTTGYVLAAASTWKAYTAVSQSLTIDLNFTGANTVGIVEVYFHITFLDKGADQLINT